LNVEHVRALRLVTPDGAVHDTSDPDPLFRLALAGRGQLGIIVAATLLTVRKPLVLAGRVARWRRLDDFLDDAAAIRGQAAYDFMRARLDPVGAGVTAHLGNAADALPRHDPGRVALALAEVGPLESVDLADL